MTDAERLREIARGIFSVNSVPYMQGEDVQRDLRRIAGLLERMGEALALSVSYVELVADAECGSEEGQEARADAAMIEALLAEAGVKP